MNVAPRGLSFTDAPRGRREERSEEGRASGAGGGGLVRLALSGACCRGGAKKKGGSPGTQRGKAKRRLPFTPDSFCYTQTSKAGKRLQSKTVPGGLPIAPQSA